MKDGWGFRKSRAELWLPRFFLVFPVFPERAFPHRPQFVPGLCFFPFFSEAGLHSSGKPLYFVSAGKKSRRIPSDNRSNQEMV